MLLVEDSATQAEQLRAILEGVGIDVILAADGELALAALADTAVDLVVTDIVMPVMSGYELCRRIKSSPRYGTLPVVLLSSLSDSMDIIHGLECGADNFVTKPYEPDRLVARIQAILHMRGLGNRVTMLGIEIEFLGRRFTINPERVQILDLLLSTFEETVRANGELRRNQAELAAAQRRLEEYAQALEGRVRLSEEKFRGFLGASPDAMLVVDDAGAIIVASERIESLFGHHPDELAGRPFDVLLPERLRERHAAHVRAFLTDPRPREMGVGMELVALRKDGSEFATEVTLSPHKTPEGTVVIAAVRDVTGRKQSEAALRQAQKMEAVGQLTSGVAHDFNNVLGAVIGGLDLLLDLVPDRPEAAHYAELSMSAALGGADLVKRLLAFARREPLRRRAIDVRDVIAAVVPLIRRTLGERITIRTRVADDVWHALTDTAQIEGALLNLAINARDAMVDGGTVTIDCRNVTIDPDFAPAYDGELAPGDYVVISVTDTGHGMTADVAARAFDPFFTTKEQGVGTGLGLSSVLGTMKQSGGTARIYSEIGRGTTVRAYIPRTTEAGVRHNGPPANRVSQRGDERILVVEDNERIREVSCAMLVSLGYRIAAVATADEALARVSAGESFDLVFSDVVVPGRHTGVTLAHALRKIDPKLKIVLTSGYASPSVAGLDAEEPEMELISKPFRKAELAAVIRRVLDCDTSGR